MSRAADVGRHQFTGFGSPRFLWLFSGQPSVVSLPAGQQQVLDEIESDLESCEPRLRSMFAIFTRLNRDEEAPRTESLRPGASRPWRTWLGRGLAGPPRAIIAVPVVLGLLTLCVFLAITSSAARGCTLATGSHAVMTARTSCQSVLQSHGRS